MKKTHSILLITVCIFITTAIDAQKKTVSIDKNKIIPDSQIKKSIQTFINLVDSQHIHQFGLKNVAELDSLKPGKQFRYFMIGLYDIKNYKQDDDVKKIIKEYPSVEVSLINGAGKIRTSIEFEKNKNNWEPAGYGSTSEMIVLRRLQDVLGNSVINKGDLIRIPALRTSFISVSSAAGLEFISLTDHPNLNLYAGQKIAASAAILRLVPLAKKHNGKPS